MIRVFTFFFLFLNYQVIFSQNLYPYGNEFPLGLYSLHTDLDSANYYGWNHGHRYGYRIDGIRYLATPIPDSYYIECKENNICTMARLSWIDSLDKKWPPSVETTVGEITQQEYHSNISWWDIPEELRYWKNSEYYIVKKYPELIREYDSKKRPTYMYIPGHYNSQGVENYVPYLDILSASCYSNYQNLPNIYVRWSIERTQKAIINKGFKAGKDYLNNEKTVIAILELFEQEAILSENETWHDFWLALACDVKGIQVFSHFYRNSSLTLKKSWNTLNRAIKIFKENKIDKAILDGNNIFLHNRILSGPSSAPLLVMQNITYTHPSLKILAKEYNDTTYVIAVNSAEEKITFQITDIPPLIIGARKILSNEFIEIKKQVITDTLKALDVALYKLYTDKSKIESLIYPCPAENNITIKIINSNITFDKVKIFDISGEFIKEEVCDYCLEKSIDIKHHSIGTYIIQLLRNGEQIATNKFVISY